MFSPAMKKGSIELLLLSLLEDRDRHGYEIGKLIEQRSRGQLQFRISSLYPVLCRMEERGWIKGRWVEKAGARRRRFYRLTDKGKEALAREKETWDAYTQAVSMVLEPTNV